jgi:3-hydroxyisobutyrate dehydrogenase-like beta-hydroxyacid dehydrogenase
VVGSGSGNSTVVELKARPMIERDFDPLFKLEHMLKDVRHFLSEARDLGVQAPVAERAASVYAAADAMGLGGRDFAAVIDAAARADRPQPEPQRPPKRTPRGFRP